MDITRHIIKNEKQKKKMKNRALKKISLYTELFLANNELCPATALEKLLRINSQYYYKGKCKDSSHTKSKQELSLKCFRSNIAYTFNIISLNCNDAQVDICTLNVELNNYKISILAIIKNVEPLLGLILYSAKGNVEINNESLLKSLKFEKDNLYVTNKKSEINNSTLYSLNHITYGYMVKNFGIIFNSHCKMKIVHHMLFSVWLFQDISMGYWLSAILTANYINIFHVNKNNMFVIIRIHENSRLKFNFELFPLRNNNIITSWIPAFKSHLPLTVKTKYFELNASSKINAICCFNNLKNRKYEKQDKSTYVVYKSPRTYFTECGMNTEQTESEIDRDSQIDIINDNYFEFINSRLWIPFLCGDCYNDNIGNISYILKCSCLNESLLDLDNIERYMREIANILTSLKFYTTTLKDLSKYLAYIFMKL